MIIELDEKQLETVEKIKEWFEECEANLDHNLDFGVDCVLNKPIFRVFGYAGTGKTTIIRYFMEALDIRSDTLFAAYTGKAAMVMRKTGLPASTIHSLIYEPVPPSKEECQKLIKELESATDTEEKARLKAELKEKSKVHFVLRDKENSRLNNTRLLVLDECSMVNEQMKEDLLTFQIPMIVLGDPGQLPPIEGEGAFTKGTPDVMLTEIHRQAKDNPIIDFATRARAGIFIPKFTLGTSSHTSQTSLRTEEVLMFDQIITGKNLTRQKINQRVRGLRGFDSIYPQVGEKLICLKNEADKSLFNGLMCEVVEVGELLDVTIELKVKLETDHPGKPATPVTALRAYFEQYQDPKALEGLRWWDRDGNSEFDFGYAITCHKSQGSQWDKVLIWDDGFLKWKGKWKERNQWLYTAITRAVESVTIAS